MQHEGQNKVSQQAPFSYSWTLCLHNCPSSNTGTNAIIDHDLSSANDEGSMFLEDNNNNSISVDYDS